MGLVDVILLIFLKKTLNAYENKEQNKWICSIFVVKIGRCLHICTVYSVQLVSFLFMSILLNEGLRKCDVIYDRSMIASKI